MPITDLNELLHREQVAYDRAHRAATEEMRRVYTRMAADYRARINARPFVGSDRVGAFR
ncbi:hypothetical protein [Sphingomicrobium arenosum]|uniref:hypothetical protein n=1 Tax=Sphingomicrobium arenosum TaxID=2233861 RepID=UPI002240D942|nr:hypothetical protein [Sphingomicrobium arenosum]